MRKNRGNLSADFAQKGAETSAECNERKASAPSKGRFKGVLLLGALAGLSALAGVLSACGIERPKTEEIPYSVQRFLLDFEKGDAYIAGEITYGSAPEGTVVDAEGFVPAHFALNTQKTVPMSVTKGAENILKVYLDPLFTSFSDALEGGDTLLIPETERDAVYLERADGSREKCSSFDPSCGVFCFGAEAPLFGKITGDRFYYFDRIEKRPYADALGSKATLTLGNGQRASYEPEAGCTLSGEYIADMGRGVFVMTLDEGVELEFILAQKEGELCFMLGDGISPLCYGGDYIASEDTLLYYLGAGESFRVPDGVKTIAFSAFLFDGAENLTSIDLNETKVIEPRALQNAGGLSSLEGDVEYIGYGAFEGLSSLTDVTFLKAETIGARAFYGCEALERVALGAVARIGGQAFSRSLEGGHPLTVDLTAAGSLDELIIAADAFSALQTGEENASVFTEGSAVLVEDVDALNAATQAFGTAFSPMPICIQTEDEATMSEVAFYDLLENALYLFRNGSVEKNVYLNYSWQSEPLFSYYVKEGAAHLYAFDEEKSGFVELGVCTKDSPYLPVDGKQILPLGNADFPVTLQTADEDGGALELRYYVTLSLTWGISINKYMTGVKYLGAEATNVNFSYSSELSFTADGKAYRGQVGDGKVSLEYLGRDYLLEDKSDPSMYYRASVRVDDEGNLTMQKMEFCDSPSATEPSYKTFYGSKVDGENKWKYEQDGYLLQFEIVLDGQGVPSLKGEILGYVVSEYIFSVSLAATLKVEEGKIAGLIEFRERYSAVPEKDLDLAIAEDGLSIRIGTTNGIYLVTLDEKEGKISLALSALELTQNSILSEDYAYSADLRFEIVDGEKVLLAVAHFYYHYDEIGIVAQNPGGASGTVAFETADGRHFTLSLDTNAYGGECIVVETV